MTRFDVRRLCLEDVLALPATLRPEESFQIGGIGRTLGYRMIRSGEWPSLRFGARLVVPTQPLLRLLGIDINELRGSHEDD